LGDRVVQQTSEEAVPFEQFTVMMMTKFKDLAHQMMKLGRTMRNLLDGLTVL
jgi:hypothetical protein